MKKIFVLMLVLCLFGCVTAPVVSVFDTTGLAEAAQPYVEAWGPFRAVNTHICDECEGVVILFWFDGNTMSHYVRLERIDGVWIVTDASEILQTKYKGLLDSIS